MFERIFGGFSHWATIPLTVSYRDHLCRARLAEVLNGAGRRRPILWECGDPAAGGLGIHRGVCGACGRDRADRGESSRAIGRSCSRLS
jgi:hypothetical protein